MLTVWIRTVLYGCWDDLKFLSSLRVDCIFACTCCLCLMGGLAFIVIVTSSYVVRNCGFSKYLLHWYAGQCKNRCWIRS